MKQVKLSAGVAQAALEKVAAINSPKEKIAAALEYNLFTFAAMLTLTTKSPVGIKNMPQIVRGLSKYDPRLTPLNLKSLIALSEAFPSSVALDSYDKASIIGSVLNYGDPQLVSPLFKFVSSTSSKILISSYIQLQDYALRTNSLTLAQNLYQHMVQSYPHTVYENAICMVNFMNLFSDSNSNKLKDLSREIAHKCLPNSYNPSVAVAIARVALRTQDIALGEDLEKTLKDMDPQVSNILNALNTLNTLRTTNKSLIGEINPNELKIEDLSLIMKKVAEEDINKITKILDSISAPDDKTLAKVTLCEQYIENGDLTNYIKTFSELNTIKIPGGENKAKAFHGELLLLKLKWSARHDSFARAKRHYINWSPLEPRYKVKALELLESMKDCDLLWLNLEFNKIGIDNSQRDT
ncbi:hypothetical protein DASB73_023130 [Starmerella bacillaris]|uniref:Uncharacterized protein n=1 Tax=Starmerella bacillaris TaxID=1247836 RepID=A0AAV5RIJ8_STABA|nr:hypothetical protein DASB73_023130 [Starmerella bacillaris]